MKLRFITAICAASLAWSSSPLLAATALEAQKLVPQSFKDKGYISAAVSAVDAPHAFLKEGTTEWTGYEVDLLNALGKVLNLEIKYTQAPFQQLIVGVSSGRSDLSVGDVGDNDLRQKQVDFIDHSQITFQLTVPKGNPDKIKNVYDLCGNKLGVVIGTTDIIGKALTKCTALGKPVPEFISFPDQPSKYQAAQSGRIPIVDIIQTDTARYFADHAIYQDVEYIDAPEVGNLYIGFITKKGNTEFQKAVVAGLEVLFEDGTYAEILKKYNISDHAIDKPGINIGSAASNWVQSDH